MVWWRNNFVRHLHVEFRSRFCKRLPNVKISHLKLAASYKTNCGCKLTEKQFFTSFLTCHINTSREKNESNTLVVVGSFDPRKAHEKSPFVQSHTQSRNLNLSASQMNAALMKLKFIYSGTLSVSRPKFLEGCIT